MKHTINFLSAIANAQKRSNIFLFFPFSKKILNILNILKFHGFVSNYRLCFVKKRKHFEIFLKYHIKNVKFIIALLSKPTQKKFISKKDIWKLSKKAGFFLLSTAQGIFSDKQACYLNIGGKILFYIT